ncbi:MAG TPA: HipA domain-containing protein [Solirubrobacterales bacterium]|jgi:serine/threonine-protein kinase HipA|nr:HipA domain-containing protein [Solirubrobacterales bacterium]
MNALDVFLHDERVGRVERLAGATLRFSYLPTWLGHDRAQALSLHLPLREEPFGDFECRPFFAGLIPEGDFLKAIARIFHVAAENPFSVLEEIGGECAGAVSLVAPGAPLPALSAPPPRWLDRDDLGGLLERLPSRPLLAGPGDDEGVRLSLAGTTDKLPVLWDGERIGITRGLPPSTHIVKKPIPGVEDMVANEAYCLALAGSAGLAAAEATPLVATGQEGLLVRRFDRHDDGGAAGRIHQEDVCQALGFVPAEKYESDGGPGVASCAVLLRERSAAPAVDLLALLDALLFNLLIGNCDAHAKNYSLLLEGAGSPRLAPLYDLLSTRAYPELRNRKMAMKYGGEYRADRIRGRHLARLAADLDVAPRIVRARAVDLAERVRAARLAARAGLSSPWQDAPLLDRIDSLIEATAEALARAVSEPA